MIGIAILILLGAYHTWGMRDRVGGVQFANDFAPSYCAAAAWRAGGNPYLEADSLKCGGHTDRLLPSEGRVQAAPLPGYELAFFSLFTFLPYVPATVLWLGISFVGLLLAAYAVARMSGLPFVATFAAFAPVGGYTDLVFGQIPPLTVGIVALAALALSTGRPRWAAVAACGALLEPHIAIAPIVALFVWSPRSRLPLAAIVVALAAISVAALGLDRNIEYVRQVIPLQSAAEVPVRIQVSLTYLLHTLGVGDSLALRIGSLQFALFAFIGIAIAKRVADAVREPGLIVLVPAALSVVGGPYMHLFQMVFALPALLILANRAPTGRAAAWGAAMLLAMFWPWFHGSLTILPVGVLVVLAWCAFGTTRARLIGAALAAVVFLGINAASFRTPERVIRPAESVAAYEARMGTLMRYSTAYTGARLRSHPTDVQVTYRRIVEKIPTAIGLVLLLFAVGTNAYASARERESRLSYAAR